MREIFKNSANVLTSIEISKFTSLLWLKLAMGVFMAMGVPPIAGGFRSWKIPI